MKKIFTFLMLLMVSTLGTLAADTWTVAGTAAALNGTADWSTTNTANDMTSQDGNYFTLTVEGCTLEKGVTYQFKVVKNHSWDVAYPGDNKTFTVSETAVYTVEYTFDATTTLVTVETTKTGAAGEVTHTYSLAGEPLSVFGGSKTWDEKNESTTMTAGANGIYSWTKAGIELPAKTSVKFKVVVDYSWGQAYPNQDVVKTIEEAALYDLVFTFNSATKAVDMVANKKGDSDIENTYIIAGSSETLFGTAWDGTNEANKMTKNSSGLFEKKYTNATLTAGVIEWKVVMNGSEWIPDGEGNNLSVYVPEDGTYDLEFYYDEDLKKPASQLFQDGKPVNVTPKGEGWPANYDGVMLQAFYWNSFDDTKFTNLTAQAEKLSKYFDLIWVPNSGATGGEGMGYLPVWWFNHNSNFGRQKTLVTMIQTFNALGTKVIEDVVLNHKAPRGANGSWVDFVNEKWEHDGITEELNWTTADICQNDDGGDTNAKGALESMIEMNGGWTCTGANDTGDDFGGGRDLDHTSANVQKNCILYQNFLMKELGYSGFRLDMVKGYGAQYTRIYNEATKPEFCVGEYWSGKDDITNWIAGTGMTSAAFDFPFKYQMMKAFGSERDWSALDWKGIAEDTYWQRYAVTFIDNHDTYEHEGRLVGNVLGANAFMLAMPGTPCVFLKHWQRYPIAIGNMILARKAAGITNQSPITESKVAGDGYVLKVQGTNGSVICLAGNASYDTTGFKVIAKGNGFAYLVSENVTVNGLQEGNDTDEQKDITIYVQAKDAPYIYSWNSSGEPTNGAWPGTKMTTTATKEDGQKFWTADFSVVPVNVIFNNGNGVQTDNIENITHDSYYTFDPTNDDKLTNWTDITSNYFTPDPIQLPACAKPIDGHLYCYFQGNKDYDSPRAWVWNEDKNFCANTTWPGDVMKRVGDDGQGHMVWLWDAGDIEEIEGMPTGVLFSNNGDPQTDNFNFVVGGYYDATGYIGNVLEASQGIEDVNRETITNHRCYDLMGRRVVNTSKPGLYIRDGRKFIVR